MDYHVENRRYKDGQAPKGDTYFIRLNTVVDAWAGQTREDGAIDGDRGGIPGYVTRRGKLW